MLEIGLSGLPLDYPFSGTAEYIRHLTPLLPEVAPDLSFRLFLKGASASPGGVATKVLSTPLAPLNRGAGIGARLDKLVWETIALPLASASRREALLHSLYFAAPAVSPAPLVLTIHDLIPLVLPEYHRTRQSALYSRLMARLAKRARAIITVSEHSKRDIVRVLGFPEDRIHVTYEAPDPTLSPSGTPGEAALLRQRYGLPAAHLLYTGGAESRKNIGTLVRAYARVVDVMRERGIGLVLVADFPPPDRLYPDIPRLIRELNLGRDVVVVSRVQPEDRGALYRSALAFCFPSEYEGFGLTPLEAMASGVPVIASNATSIPEVVGSAAITLDPRDVPGWAEAMGRLAESEAERGKLRALGLARAARFSWRSTAERTVEVYRQVLGE